MIWSRRKPEKAGWWWWKPSDKMAYIYGDEQVIEVCQQTLGLWLQNHGWLEDYDGEWSSEPIEPPNEA